MLHPLRFPRELIVDTEGRPLLERFAPPQLQQGVPMELVECRYSGSRFKHANPMNVSALRQMQEHWDDALEGIAYLRSLYCVPEPEVTCLDLWRIGELCARLPEFLVYRADSPLHSGIVPAHVAAIFKIAVGLNHATLRFTELNMLTHPEKLGVAIDVDELYSFIEAQQFLISPHGVCAGPEKLIRRAVRALVANPGDIAATNKTAAAVGATSAFLAYAFGQMNAMILDRIFASVAESIYAGLCAQCRDVLPFLQQPVAHLAVFAVTGNGSTRKLLQRLVGSLLPVEDRAKQPQFQGALECIPALFDPDCSALSEIRDRTAELLDGVQHADAQVIEWVARYLALEQAGAVLATILKEQCLRALALHRSMALRLSSETFQPPHLRMRQLLATVFSVEISPAMTVKRGAKSFALAIAYQQQGTAQ